MVVTTGGVGATGICWVDSKDVAKHPAMHRAAPCNNSPVPNANSAKVENSWFK